MTPNADASAIEGDSGTTPMSFTLSLSAASGRTVTVAYATQDGTATVAGSDYAATSGTVTLPPGVTTASVTVQVTGDAAVEPDETFAVSLSAPINATIAAGQGIGTIVNDDVTPPAASITVTAPNGGESWRVNRNQTIRWSSTGVSGSVRISLSRNGGGSWETLFGSTANDGRQGWRVTGPQTSQALVEVCSLGSPAVCDRSNAVFTIRP